MFDLPGVRPLSDQRLGDELADDRHVAVTVVERGSIIDGEAIIIRLHNLPGRFDALRHQSEASGYRFLRRVADEWENGANRFDRDGEALLAAEIGGQLVGVCGLSIDAYMNVPRIGRVRNVYVLAEYRRRGIGGLLVLEAIKLARGHFDVLRLRGEKAGPEYVHNAVALRSVQPEDVLPGDLDANLGAPWIPASDVQAFAAELFNVPAESFKIGHLKKDAVWAVEPDYRALQSVAVPDGM